MSLFLKRFFFSIFVVGLLSHCASFRTQKAKVLDQKGTWDGTTILFAYELTGVDPSIKREGCDLILRNHTAKIDYQINLKANQDKVFFAAAPGTYTGVKLSCPRFRTWELDKFLKREIELVPNRINYFGKVGFGFSRTKDSSKETIPRSLNIQYLDRKESSVALSDFFKSLNLRWKNDVVIPATGKPIKKDMLESDSNYRMRIRVTPYAEDKTTKVETSALKDGLNQCIFSDHSNYFVRLGELEFFARYEESSLKEFEKKKENHAFSDEFVECVESSLKNFSPKESYRIDIGVSL